MASTMGPLQAFRVMNSLAQWKTKSNHILSFIRNNSQASFCGYYSQDPGPLFFNPRVQALLRNLTGNSYDKVFRQKKLGQKLQPPKYRLMSEEDLQAAIRETQEKASYKLQMPPLIREREPINQVLSQDPEVQGFDTARYIFTDITYGVSDRKRWIVVRDTDGTLRQASWEERAKMNHVYFPQPGRQISKPKLFEDENLQACLDRGDYEFILDNACVQFEPDDPEYVRVTRKTYDLVSQRQHYSSLHSTRHYGPMVLHLVLSNQCDDLMIYLVTNKEVTSVADLVRLYHVVNPDSKLLDGVQDDVELIKVYKTNYSLKRALLERAWEAYEEIMSQERELRGTMTQSS